VWYYHYKDYQAHHAELLRQVLALAHAPESEF
jgi:hypothetical protein